MPASSRDTNTHHAPSVSRGPSLNLLPDKSQTLILPSFASCLQHFHPEAGAWGLAPGAALRPARWAAGTLPLPGAGRMLCLTAWSREGMVANAGLRQAACRAKWPGEGKALQQSVGEGIQWKQKPFHSACYQRVQMGLGNPRPAWPMPSAGLWSVSKGKNDAK